MDARPAGRGPGPSRSALVALALMSAILLATSQAQSQLKGAADGNVTIGPGQVVEHEVRVHLDPAGGEGATSGTIGPTFLAASGLDTSYPIDVDIAFSAGSAADGEPVPVDGEFPVARCLQGCDLTYVVRITGGPTVLPGSVVRYRIGAVIIYGGAFGQRDPALMRIDVPEPAAGPVPAIWAVVTGLLAIGLGVVVGPRMDAALGARRRRWPAWILAALPAVVIGSQAVGRVAAGAAFGVPWWQLVLFAVEPWSLGLLIVLTWGMVRGLQRWDGDGGWALGLAAVAVLGLGGLWLAWWATTGPAIQPILSVVVAGALGLLGGAVVGQAWRTDPRTSRDRWWAATAVLAHGIVVAGFGSLAVRALFDPFSGGGAGLLLLIPAVLVVVALRRWFGGRSAWLILFDLLIAGVGLLGVWVWTSSNLGLADPTVGIDDVAVGIAVAAAVAAFATSLHAMPRRGAPADPFGPSDPSGPSGPSDSAGPSDREAISPSAPPAAAAGDPATT